MKWRWQFSTQRLRDAYDAARDSLNKTLHDLDKENKRCRKQQPDPTSQDEIDGHAAWEDDIAERHHVTTKSLDAIKHGFAVILYHSWEKNAVAWAKWGSRRYHHGQVTGYLKRNNFTIQPGVHKLQKVANCIKHNSDELWKQDQTMFDPIVGDLISIDIKPDFSRNIILTDDQMNEFFDDLMASGPTAAATPSL